MKDRMRIFLSILLAVVFSVSTGLLIRQKLHEKSADEAYQSAQQLATSQEEPETTAPTEATEPVTEPEEQEMSIWIPELVSDDENVSDLLQIDLAALREKNPEVVGWIRIPDTKIDYPFLQTDNNTFYLEHAWNGKKNSLGAIFMETQNSQNLMDFNTILYGHNMMSGRMFATLHKFSEQDFWEDHPYVYLVTDGGVFRYEIFSTYDAEVESGAYRLSFRQEDTRVEFLEEAIANSLIETGIVPQTTDRILTLSTCTGLGYEARRVVHARLKMVELAKG